ncbi:MAG: ABC transporter ATP-binding protein [Pseudomonadota bacterium]
MNPVLEVKGLNKAYGGVHAVQDVSFNVAQGELRALIGPNGAGKTTCFNLLNGQLQADSGQVFFQGREITGLPPRKVWRLGLGRTFQIAAPFASMRVVENLQMALISHHGRLRQLWPRADRLYRDQALSLLTQLGLEEVAERTCGTLAYGDLKRLELAVALAHDPVLLLMDEPTAGMAPEEREGLMEQVVRLVQDRGMSVLFTEHDMSVVFGNADRILVLDQGQVLADGTVRQVQGNSAVQQVYLGSLEVPMNPDGQEEA